MGINIRQPGNHKNTWIKGDFGNDNVVELGDGRNIIVLTGLDSTVILGDGAGNYIRFIDPETGGGGINRGTVGNGGNSTIIGAENSQNVLISNDGAEDRVYGGGKPDVLIATGTGAQVFGRNGNDMLLIGRGHGYGGPGNDTLQGYDGSTLHGGTGRDTFVPIVLGPETRVTISDFKPLLGDRVNLAFLGFHAPGGVEVAQKDDNTVFSYVDPDAGAATLTLQGTGAAFADFTAAVNQGWVINAPTQL